MRPRPLQSLAGRLSLLVVSMAVLVSIGVARCDRPQPRPQQDTEPKPDSGQVAGVKVAITAIDRRPVVPGERPDVGQRVLIEGTSSSESAVICVLVHPLTTDTWWVQSLPAPPNRGEGGLLRWRLMAFCGEDKLGVGEEYEIVALAESRRSICQQGREIGTADFPVALPRSEIVTVFRDRD